MNSYFFIIALIVAFLIPLYFGYLLMTYIYGEKDPRKWKSLLFTEKDTDRTILTPNQGKDKPNNEAMVDTEVEARKKKNKFFLLASLCIPLLCAVLYRIFPATLKNYIFFGAVSVTINMFLYFYLAFKNRLKIGDEFYDNTFILIGGGLTLIIPYSIFYILFSVILSGFRFPVGY